MKQFTVSESLEVKEMLRHAYKVCVGTLTKIEISITAPTDYSIKYNISEEEGIKSFIVYPIINISAEVVNAINKAIAEIHPYSKGENSEC